MHQGADIIEFPIAPDASRSLQMPEYGTNSEPSIKDLLISRDLHRSLELGDVLDTFLRALRAEYPISGLRHVLADCNEQITLGRVDPASIEIHARHEDESLGILTLGNIHSLDLRLNALLALLPAPLYNAICHQRLKNLARKDALTGLGNRLAMQTCLTNEVARAQRFGQPFTLLVVDIDHFKRINDTYGHATGDLVIRRLAAQIRHSLRPYDQAFRYGGEEFVVLLSQTTLTKGLQIAERIRASANARRLCEAGGETVSVSIGAAEFQCEDENLHQLFDRADRALYEAKRGGRNQVRTG